ncbi:MAG: hypothetical protein KDA53_01930 [Hyphomonas sp.]|nr:hypothetical protein [Hyphomonas sp.]
MATDASGMEAGAAAEWAARTAYGKLVAQLTAQCGDLAVAEDALADAFARALEAWPRRGIPASPEAWLMAAAKRRTVDAARRRQTEARHAAASVPAISDAPDSAETKGDRRLELLFLCAHPALPESVHTPLMLQAVLGFTAEEIAAATLEPPARVGQRLVRAKRRLAEAKVPFALPPAHILRERMAGVQRAIYAAYSSGWDDAANGAEAATGLASEAEWLARCLVRLAPEDAEAKGLLSLILYCESRRPARRDDAGRFVPLDRQDTGLWDTRKIGEASALLRSAAARRVPGRFQFEAAIQAAHADRRKTGQTDWAMVRRLYRGLMLAAPSLGAQIGEAAAALHAGAPEEALGLLGHLDASRVAGHGPYWATRAHVLQALQRHEEASEAFERAAALAPDDAARDFLLAARLRAPG